MLYMQGTGIQACAKDNKQRVVEGRLRVGSCYQLRKYACEEVEEYWNILTHSTYLIVGGASLFTPIPVTEDIPKISFDFATRDRMENACDKETMVTTDKKSYLLLTIQDCSYRLSVSITDGTGSINGTIFDDAVTQLVEKETSETEHECNKGKALEHVNVKPDETAKLQPKEASKIKITETLIKRQLQFNIGTINCCFVQV
ncbi:hypothetical protein QVD17_30814 [Tagetes erecta]|uniref:Uncharacterized protein n=1 Tax=Tagetes erecta TaxID=13708 RepID=A0AAD8K8L5_TARER|nr:hypothetical protein QVD17_30814 [Tagetes erecta]